MKLFNNLFKKKEVNDNLKYIDSEISQINRIFHQPRFNRQIAINSYNGFFASAIDYNCNAVANGIIRLYSRTSKNGVKCRFNTIKHNDIYQRNYFAGKNIDKPSADVVYKTQNIMENFELVQDHPIIKLFIKANPFQSTYQFLFQIVLNLEITGDAFIHVVSFTDGTPAELYVLQSQYMDVIPAETGMGRIIDKYEYKKRLGTPVEYSIDEIIHIKYPNPKSDGLFYGMGKIEKGWQVYLMNKFSHDYQIALYANNAVPDYLLINKSGNTISRKRFFRKMKNINQGASNSGNVMAVDGDIDIKTIAFKPKDLSDVKLNITEIASITGVPVDLLTGASPTSSNSKQDHNTWLRITVSSIMKLVASSFSEQLLWRYGIADGDAYLSFDSPVPEDIIEKSKLDETYSKMAALTPNEIRAGLGRELLGPELDEVYFNGNRLGDNKTSNNNFSPEKNIKDNENILNKEVKDKLDNIIKDIVEIKNKEIEKKEVPILVAPVINVINKIEEEKEEEKEEEI